MKYLGIFLGFLMTMETLAASQRNPQTDLIFAVAKESGETRVYINNRDHWIRNYTWIDKLSSEDSAIVTRVAEKAKLCIANEGAYSLCRKGQSLKQVREELIRNGILPDANFQKFMDGEVK